MFRLSILLLIALDFTGVDREFVRTGDYAASRETLLTLLPKAGTDTERAEVFWRLSRTCLMLGETASSKEEKRNCFAQGLSYADSAIAAAPANPEGYMWHCANTGRDCQTRSLMEQAASVPKMTADLTMILETLGRTDCSEAWQALSEIYWAHPFKSDESAVNFARKAAMTIPQGEMRIATLTHLATLLYKRDWSARKRTSASESARRKFADAKAGNIERFSWFNGAPAEDLAVPWLPVPFGSLSDREEALAILAHAQRLYAKCTDPTPIDQNDYTNLLDLLKKWE